MKKLSVFLLIVLLAGCFFPPVRAESGESAAEAGSEAGAVVFGSNCGEQVSWVLERDTLTISGSGDMYWYDMGSAPWYDLRSGVRRVVVEDGVADVTYSAFFYFTDLTEVSLPRSLTKLGGMAFYGCTALEQVYIPSQVSEIGDYAFYGCRSLQEILVNDDNEYYRDEDGVLFRGNMLLCYPPAHTGEEYRIPNGTEQVGECAFSYSALRRVSVPSTVWELDATALTDCLQLEAVEVDWDNWYYASADGVLYDFGKTELITYPARKTDSSFSVPETVRHVAIRAFACNSYLQRVDFLGSVEELGSLAFVNCSALRRAVFHAQAPRTMGFSVFTTDTTVFYLEGKDGWESADFSGWNVAGVQVWTSNEGLLLHRGRLLK